MRSHEERIAEVRRRIAEKERQKRRKQRRIVAISCIAACLAVIVGVSFAMPGIVGQIVFVSICWTKKSRQSRGGTAPMELIINLLQFSVTLLGFCLSGIRYLRHRTLSYFLLICFYGCFALGSLYWTFMYRNSAGSPALFFSVSYNILSPPRRKEAFPVGNPCWLH